MADPAIRDRASPTVRRRWQEGILTRALALFLIVLVASLVSRGSGGEQPSQSPRSEESSDPSLERYVQQCNEAIATLQSRLVEALTAELKTGGPEGAVRVCREEAQAITTLVAQEKGIAVGRTSHRLRNPVNQPRYWTVPFVDEGAGKRVNQVESHVVDLGDRVGVLKPIGTLELCTNCHGVEDEIVPEVQAVLAAAYPKDQAVGFRVGDLRGWMWAEIPKE